MVHVQHHKHKLRKDRSMADSKQSFITELNAEVGKDLSKFAQILSQELRATTPIRTGQARGGWVNTYNGGYGKIKTIPLASNKVPYIGVLDSNKTSQQAPLGIVEPALQKATRRV